MEAAENYTYIGRPRVPAAREYEYTQARYLAENLDDMARELQLRRAESTGVKGLSVEDRDAIEDGFREVRAKLGALIVSIREAAERIR